MNSRRGIPVTLIGVVAVIALIALFAFLLLPRPEVRPGPLPEEDLAELSRLRNEGLAYLENGEWGRSNELFAELVRRLPEEPLPARNLAVSHVLFLTDLAGRDPEALGAAEQAAEEAVQRVKALEPDHDAGFILASRIEQARQNPAAALRQLLQAGERSPQEAAIGYELYSVARYAEDEPTRALSREGLRQSYLLAPQNLVVLLDWLLVQADGRDPGIIGTLQRAGSTFDAVADGIRRRVRIDVRELVAAAREAAESDDWITVERNVRILSNVTRSDDAAQSDRLRIERHSLELVLDEFSPEIERQIEVVRRRPQPGIPVQFRPIELSLGDEPVLDLHGADFDLDGRLDLCVLREGTIQFFMRGEEGAEWTERARLDVPSGMARILAADLDNDADPAILPEDQEDHLCHSADLDLVVYGKAGLVLLRAELAAVGGALQYSAVELGELAELREVRQVAVADLSNDGDLDLIVLAEDGLSLWSNRGNFTFGRIEFDADWGAARPVAVLPVDWDRDLDQDLLVLLETGTLGYLENLRHATFRWRELERVRSDAPGEGTLAITDVDNSGSWDLLLGDGAGLHLYPTRMPARGSVTVLDRRQILDQPVRQIHLWDYDNDGNRDLLLVGERGVMLLRGRPDRSFEERPRMLPVDPGDPVDAVVSGDLDADGDDDLLLLRAGRIAAFENVGGNRNGWIDVALLAQQVARGEASASGRVNHYGLGSLIELRAGTGYQQQWVTSQRTRFGTGQQERVDALRVLWPNGIPENVLHPRANEVLCERQSLKGSCPYLYCWNGERYEFVTDLLWASPIGLQDPRGELVPCREWEYLRIPGELLREKGGEYRLQLTEELWEIAYFDHVQLLAVDHPEEIEVYSNEKVGPPSISEFRIHAVRERRYPVSAKNHHGRNLLPLLSARDERYARPFEKKIRQGYTEDSFIELDLGPGLNGRGESSRGGSPPPDPGRPRTVKLFLTGWIYPTDTSINAALRKNPDLPGPRPPWISVPDEAGTFREVLPFMGFPGGKTKTIVVDVSDIFLTEDFRLRINTSQELYWDEIFFTVEGEGDEEASPFTLTPLSLTSADLRYRGFSERIEHPHDGPERYDYSRIRTAPAWPAISGRFTRYGDVRELLVQPDDRMVIMGPGDELTLRFAVPDNPLPAGWKRDFILHNVGWDKDADLNTVYGQTVEPLPFRGMSKYPYWPEQEAPAFEEDRRTYQTREIDPRPFRRQLLRNRGGLPPD